MRLACRQTGTIISRSQYVYLQRPDTAPWVTVGRYTLNDDMRSGSFVYAPSYLDAGLPWAIDPVNLPLQPGVLQAASRYGGLHDVLRDAAPDAWGQLLLQRAHGLGDNTHTFEYLRLAGNGDRWGALALGASRTPPSIHLKSPTLPQLRSLAEELLAMHERRPPEDARVRRMLMATPNLGGARPKGTLRDGDDYWLVKPLLQSDVIDIPRLEHATMAAVPGLRHRAEPGTGANDLVDAAVAGPRRHCTRRRARRCGPFRIHRLRRCRDTSRRADHASRQHPARYPGRVAAGPGRLAARTIRRRTRKAASLNDAARHLPVRNPTAAALNASGCSTFDRCAVASSR